MTENVLLNSIDELHQDLARLSDDVRADGYCFDLVRKFRDISRKIRDMEDAVMKRHVETCLERAEQDGNQKNYPI